MLTETRATIIHIPIRNLTPAVWAGIKKNAAKLFHVLFSKVIHVVIILFFAFSVSVMPSKASEKLSDARSLRVLH